jgi:hypothetical protein
MRFGGELDGGVAQPEPLGAQPNLADCFFAGHIDHAPSRARHGGSRLDEDRGLADARIAADEDGGPRHEAAASDPVELGDAGQGPRQIRRCAG